MSKSYKLVREYPGSPKLGYILKQINNGKNSEDNYYVNCNWVIPSKFPEFWEEIVEKDYEILSFSCPEQWGDKLAVLNEEGEYSFSSSTSWSLNSLMCVGYSVRTGHVKIHSVKRLSDGEIFTVGDSIDERPKPKKIIEINLRDGKEGGYKEGVWLFYEKGGSSHISICKKAKQPLFTTEDGVEIFEGDKYTFVWLSRPAKGQNINTPYTKIAKKLLEGESWSDTAKFFSTEEVAEEYIKMNTPEFSRNQIIEMLSMLGFSSDALVNYTLIKKKNETN